MLRRCCPYAAADCGQLSADLTAGIRRVKGARRLGDRPGGRSRDKRCGRQPDNQRLEVLRRLSGCAAVRGTSQGNAGLNDEVPQRSNREILEFAFRAQLVYLVIFRLAYSSKPLDVACGKWHMRDSAKWFRSDGGWLLNLGACGSRRASRIGLPARRGVHQRPPTGQKVLELYRKRSGAARLACGNKF